MICQEIVRLQLSLKTRENSDSASVKKKRTQIRRAVSGGRLGSIKKSQFFCSAVAVCLKFYFKIHKFRL